MSKQKKDTVELLKQGVMSEEAMMAYLNNELSAETKQEFEKLLNDDPFIEDALEGLLASQNKSTLPHSIASINRKVRERSGLKESKTIKIHWANYAWAAVLLGLLIGIGFVMVGYFGNSDNNLAMKQQEQPVQSTNLFEEKKSDEQPLSPVQEAALDSTVTMISQKDGPGEVLFTVNKDGLKDNAAAKIIETKPEAGNKGTTGSSGLVSPAQPSTAANSTVVASGGAMAPAPNAERERNEPSIMDVVLNGSATKKSEKKPDADAESQSRALRADDGDKGKSKETSTVTLSAAKKSADKNAEDAKQNEVKGISVDEAMKSFNSGDYKLSAAQFDQVLKQQPDNTSALYFGGVSEYLNGKTAKSEKNFDKLLKDGKGFVEGSKWYKANILLKKGKKEEAQKLLNEIAASNGSYKARAVQKLDEVK